MLHQSHLSSFKVHNASFSRLHPPLHIFCQLAFCVSGDFIVQFVTKTYSKPLETELCIKVFQNGNANNEPESLKAQAKLLIVSLWRCYFPHSVADLYPCFFLVLCNLIFNKDQIKFSVCLFWATQLGSKWADFDLCRVLWRKTPEPKHTHKICVFINKLHHVMHVSSHCSFYCFGIKVEFMLHYSVALDKREKKCNDGRLALGFLTLRRSSVLGNFLEGGRVAKL